MKDISNTVTQGESYWLDDYDNFVCGLKFKIVDAGFYGAEVKYCYNCTQYLTYNYVEQSFEFEVTGLATDVRTLFNNINEFYSTIDNDCVPESKSVSSLNNVIYDDVSGKVSTT